MASKEDKSVLSRCVSSLQRVHSDLGVVEEGVVVERGNGWSSVAPVARGSAKNQSLAPIPNPILGPDFPLRSLFFLRFYFS